MNVFLTAHTEAEIARMKKPGYKPIDAPLIEILPGVECTFPHPPQVQARKKPRKKK